MYTDLYGIEEYPFQGVFYKIGIDDSKPLDEQVEEEIEVFSTPFDISEGLALSNDTFKIYFPFNHYNDSLVISVGDLFKANLDGHIQRGRIISIYPSQLGGCMAVLKMI